MLFILLAVGHEATARDVIMSSRTNTTRAVASPVQGMPSRMPVAVFAPLDIKDSLLSQICAEAEAIWKPAGITFEWHRVGATDAVKTRWLDVTIDERRSELRHGQVALGWIPFTADGPQPSIHLSRSSAEELLLRTPGVDDGTKATRETLLGRALGRALSHELGHYLLRSKVHTPHGLMQAVRSSEDFFRISRVGFEPSAQERETAARHVPRESPTEATHVTSCQTMPDSDRVISTEPTPEQVQYLEDRIYEFNAGAMPSPAACGWRS